MVVWWFCGGCLKPSVNCKLIEICLFSVYFVGGEESPTSPRHLGSGQGQKKEETAQHPGRTEDFWSQLQNSSRLIPGVLVPKQEKPFC